MYLIADKPRQNVKVHPLYTCQGLLDPAARPVEAFEQPMVEDAPEHDWTPALSLVIALASCVAVWVIVLYAVMA